MKFISWNVNGFRACLGKGFEEYFKNMDADIFCIQETKMQPSQADFSPEGYTSYFHSAEKKGYSCEYDNFYFVCCYVPNAQPGLKRIDYRMEFEDDMRNYLSELDKKKPVIYCGDLNVAHNEIDLKNPKSNVGNAGFSNEERGKMTELLDSGFADTFRRLNPDLAGVYSWWSYRFNARANNAGWRIDYFIVSERIMDKVKASEIHTDIMGSDHCPVMLEIDI